MWWDGNSSTRTIPTLGQQQSAEEQSSKTAAGSNPLLLTPPLLPSRHHHKYEQGCGGGTEDDVVRVTNEKGIVLPGMYQPGDQRKIDLVAPTRTPKHDPHPNSTTRKGPSGLQPRTVHHRGMAGGPSVFAESENSSGDYAVGCKTTLFYGVVVVVLNWFSSQCSKEEHS